MTPEPDTLRSALAEAMHDQFAPIACVSDQDIHTFAECDIKDHWLSRGGDAAAHPAVLAALATSEPAGLRDVEVERELRKRLTRHHRDEHVTALTCRSCLAALREAAQRVIDHYIGKDASVPMLTWGDIAALEAALAATPTASPTATGP